MADGTVSYNSEPILAKKRVRFSPTVTTDVLKAGYVVCYDNDITTDLNGNTIADGLQNPARFLVVEKPKTANLQFVAGIVAPSGEGAVNGDMVDIYELNGADLAVWTDQSCTNGTTGLAISDGSYIMTAVSSSNILLGTCKETINRSGTNGLVLMSSRVRTAGDTTDYATLSAVVSINSAVLSAVSNLAAIITTDEMSTALSQLTVSEATNNASIVTLVRSANSDQTASINTQIDSAISDVTAAFIAADTSTAKRLSDATSAVKESALSDVTSVATALDSAISDVVATNTSTNLSLETQLKSDIASVATALDSAISDVVATNTSTNLSLETQLKSDIASIATMVDSAISDVNATIDSAISDVSAGYATRDDSIQSLVVSADASLATMVDSAISDVNAELDAVSDLASSNSVAITALDNDAVSVLASVAFTTLTSLHIGYTKITMADGTQHSVVGFVTST